MFLNDFLDVFLVNIGVPDGFRIHDHDRPLIAAVEATGLVDPHLTRPLQLELGNAVFGISLHLGGAKGIATAFTGFALVAAEKNVMFEMAHWALLWGRQL
jgi:hypothetical protein